MRERLLHSYARFALRRPWVLVGIAALLSAVAAAVIPRLTIVTARSKQASPDHPLMARVAKFVGEFGGLETGVVVASSSEPGKTRRFMDRLAVALRAEKSQVGGVFHKLDAGPLRDKALLYAPLRALDQLKDTLARPELRPENLRKLVSLVDATVLVEAELGRALAGGAGAAVPAVPAEKMRPALDGMKRFFDELRAWIDDPRRNRIGLFADLAAGELGVARRGVDEAGYLSGKDGRTFVMFVYPRSGDDSNDVLMAFTERVRAVVLRERNAFAAQASLQDLDVGTTGIPASISDEFDTINRDLTVVSIASFVGIALLLLFSYGLSIRIVIALVPVTLGTLWTFGFASLAVGHLTLLSSVFSAVLFGLGDDFGIHLLARFEEEWGRSGDARSAAELTLVETGPGVITGAATTATAFYTTLLVEMDAFGELGLIAGTGLLLVALCAFLLLPPLFLLWARMRARGSRFAKVIPASESGHIFRSIVGGRLLRYPMIVVGIGVVATIFFFARARGIPFDYDYLKMLPPGVESTKYQLRLIETSDFTPEFNAAVASSLEELEAKAAALSKVPSVARVDSVAPIAALVRKLGGEGPAPEKRAPARNREEALAPLLPRDQAAKLERLASLAPLLRALPSPPAERPAFDLARFRTAIAALSERFDRLLEVAPPAVTKEAIATVRALGALRKALAKPLAAERVAAFEGQLFGHLADAVDLLHKGATLKSPVTAADLLAAGGGLLERLVSDRGRYALYVFPSGPIWDRAFLTDFVTETAKVDPEMTGFPVGFHHFSALIQDGFRQATLYAALAILALLLLEFRSLFTALLAAVPLCIGAATMLGLMDLCGLQYSPANIVALPLVLGMGVEYGVETVHRFSESRGLDVEGVLSTTARAILVAGSTTLLGLGTMGLANHQGLASLGLILVFGIGGCLVASILVLPSLLILVSRWRRARARG